MQDTSHLNVRVDRRFSLAELMAGIEFDVQYRISKSSMDRSAFEDRSVRLRIDLSKSAYPLAKVGNADSITLRVRGGGSSQIFERTDFFGRPSQASSTGDLMVRVIIDSMGIKISDSDLIQRVDISLYDAIFSNEILLQNPLGKKYKITEISANNLSDIKVKVQNQGLVTQTGARGAYIFEIKVNRPDLSIVSESDSDLLKELFKKI